MADPVSGDPVQGAEVSGDDVSRDNVARDETARDDLAAKEIPGGDTAAGDVAAEPAPGGRRHRRNPLIYFWFYSLARIALFLVLWGLLWLFGLGGLVGAAVALVLSVPLSYVFLARPRMAMTAAMMERLNVRQERTADLDEQLAGDDDRP